MARGLAIRKMMRDQLFKIESLMRDLKKFGEVCVEAPQTFGPLGGCLSKTSSDPSDSGSVANSKSGEAAACVPSGSYAAMPKIVWMNWRCAIGSPLATQRT